MNEHIQNKCLDAEPKSDNTCRKKGCSTKMLVPMLCPECGLAFCVKHRLEVDHQCKGKPPVKQTMPWKSTSKPVTNQQQQPSRAEIERERRDRNQRKQEIARLQNKAKHEGLTDSEQVQLAKLLSLQDRNSKCILS